MSASLLTTLLNFSRYNRVANTLLYRVCAPIPEDALKKPRANSVDSVFSILNHILIVDRRWMNRFTGVEVENVAQGKILHESFDDLSAARVEEDQRIEEFMENVSIAFLSTQFQYKDHNGQFQRDPADRLVQHMFNNQTIHRGRVCQMLEEMGKDPPETDFHILLRTAKRN